MSDDDVLGLVLGKLEGVRQQGGYWMARCPAHEDREASLSIARGTEQPVVFKCHANCDRDVILDRLGLTIADVSKPRSKENPDSWTPSGPGTAIATYIYTDPDGKTLMGVCRTADKKFWQWHPDPSKPHGRSWSTKGVRLVLYRLPKVLAAVDAGEPVYVVEGEKDVHALEAVGVTATCNPMGAGKWRPAYSKALAGAAVVIVADNDQPGFDHARQVAASLEGVAGAVRVARAAEGKDASDHLGAGHGIEDFADADLAIAPGEPGAEPEAQPDADLDGAQVLDEADQFITRYVVFPDEHSSVAVTLFAAHTHAVECFYVTPRLILDSAEPESGKTRVLELLALLCRNPKMTFSTTVAALYRRLHDKMLTVLLDEADAIWSAKAGPQAEELRAFVNSGYKRGATVDRCVGDGAGISVVEFPVFAPVAIAGIAGKMPATVTTRAVTIHMRRRAPGELIAPYEEQDVIPEARALRDHLAGWTAAVQDQLKAARPSMPEGVADRRAEIWRALLAIADAAGGEWPKRARAACEHFCLGARAVPASLGVRLLSDLKAIFGARDRMTTVDILQELTEMEEAPWGDMPRSHKPLDARGLAGLLKRYHIGPATFDILDGTGKTAKGYTTYATTDNDGLADAWRRYADELGKQGKDGNDPGQGTDGENILTVSPGKGESGRQGVLTDAYRKDESPEGAPTCELTQLTHLTEKCESRGCKEAARDCGTGTYCQRHAKMHGATWPEDTKE